MAGPPARGSIAELRGRLERLPDGHPSSPYDDAGWLRPSPARLRQLELGLPASSLGTTASYAERVSVDPDDGRLTGGERHAPASPQPQVSSPGRELLGTAGRPGPAVMPGPAVPGAGDAPDDAGSHRSDHRETAAPPGTAMSAASRLARPASPARPEQPATSPARPEQPATSPARPEQPATSPARPAAENGNHDPRDSDSRLQLQHPYAAPATADDDRNGPPRHRNGHQLAAKPPEASRAEQAGPEPDRHRPGPGCNGVPRPDDSAAGSQPRLAPEFRDLADRILAACRAAEGRNSSGGYGTSGLTPALRRIATQLPAGGLAPGSEADTLKPAGRLAIRLARLADRQPGRPPAELAAAISDGIRYAFTFPAPTYTEGTLLVHRKLKAQGFDLEARRNLWDSPEYKGVVTRWRDPAHGLAFEVQFHTTDSWAVVRQTHDAYLRITDPATPAAERARLRKQVAAVAATASPPAGSLDIADFRAGLR